MSKENLILLIEDDQSIRKNVSEYLRLSGYQTIETENGEEALLIAENIKPDIIISDIMMPKLNGIEFVKKLRKKHHFSNVPVIFMTAKSDLESMREGMNSGADDYIVKPFPLPELIELIQNKLERMGEVYKQVEVELIQEGLNIRRLKTHELNTPLHGILGSASLLLENHEFLSETNKIELYRIILSSARRLNLTLNQLFYLKELQSNPELFEVPQFINLSSLLNSIIFEKMSKFRDKEIEVHIQENCEIRSKETLCGIVLSELTDNTLKFSGKNNRKSISLSKNQNTIQIEFINEGQPFSKEEFEKTGPLKQFKKEVYAQQGLGLGLYLSKEMASNLGWSLTHHELPEKQTKILLSIPIIE